MKKLKLLLPYFALVPVIPVYMLLDRNVFLKIFGCGCVPSAQSNMLNIPFNANDLRYVIYWILTALITLWAAKMSRHFNNRTLKSSIYYRFLP